MKILGLDFETSGLDPQQDRIIEMGMVLWDTDRNVPIQVVGCLIKHAPEDNVEISPEIQELTGILPKDIAENGVNPSEALMQLCRLMEQSDYIVAHNGNRFDKPFYEAEIHRFGWQYNANSCERPWIDTCCDVPYPSKIMIRKLSYLAADHGIINTFPHRAVFDVLTMLKVLSQYDLNKVIELSESPMVTIKAEVSYDDREKAKSRGYRWNPESKMWIKEIKELQLEQEKEGADFEVTRL